MIGGIERFVSNGDTILLKPNMLSARAPDKAVTTHPEVVRAAIKLVRGAGGHPIVGDSPSGMSTESTLRSLADMTGIGRVCKEEGVEFVLFLDSEKFQFPQGAVAKSFELTTALKRVNGVISLAKFKTHSFTGLTGAVKNLFGLIPGLKKAEYHFRMQSVGAFSELLVDLAECVHPRLTIMDGIEGMEGEGPAAGKKRQLDLMIASESVHALDAFMLEIVGADKDCVETVKIARRRGLIPEDMSEIEVLGEELANLKIDGFKMPAGSRPFGRIPRAVGYLLGESVSKKPVFSKKSCTLCGSCIDACPAKALINGDRRPKIDRSTCIRCYCCQENCVENAIRLKRIPGRSMYAVLRGRSQRILIRVRF